MMIGNDADGFGNDDDDDANDDDHNEHNDNDFGNDDNDDVNDDDHNEHDADDFGNDDDGSKGTPPEKKNVFFWALPELPLPPPHPLSGNLYIFFGRQR